MSRPSGHCKIFSGKSRVKKILMLVTQVHSAFAQHPIDVGSFTLFREASKSHTLQKQTRAGDEGFAGILIYSDLYLQNY